jgi:hypothetical protein
MFVLSGLADPRFAFWLFGNFISPQTLESANISIESRIEIHPKGTA